MRDELTEHGEKGGVAFVGESRRVVEYLQRSGIAHHMPLSYAITARNEAGLEPADFIHFLADNPSTRVISVYCRSIRQPQAFTAAVRKACTAGKLVVVVIANRPTKPRQAGRLRVASPIDDWKGFRKQINDAGAAVVNTVDEMIDLVDLLQRFPDAPVKGPSILTYCLWCLRRNDQRIHHRNRRIHTRGAQSSAD